MSQQYSDNPLDKQFRDKLSGTTVQPRGRAWNRIADNLAQTNRRKSLKNRLFYISLGSAVAVSITAIVLFMSTTKQTTINNSKVTSQVVKDNSTLKSPVNNQATPVSLPANPTSNNNASATKEGNVGTSALKQQLNELNNNLKNTVAYLNEGLKQMDENPAINERQQDDIAPIAIPVTGLSIPAETTYAINDLPTIHEPTVNSEQAPANAEKPQPDSDNSLTTNNQSSLQQAIAQSSVCVKGLYAGLSFSLNNTWLLDKKARANNDFKYNFTLGKTFAIKAGYNFSNKVGIEGGCNVIAEEGQDYTFTPPVFARVEPSSLENRVKLTYTQIPVLLKYKFAKTSRLTHHPVVLNLGIGAEYGNLHSISNTVDQEDAEYANFKKTELAVIGGAGYDIYLSSKLFISTGVQAGYSSSLYNNAPISVYDQFSSPHSLTGGIYLGINYAITGCR